jgi:hypothetical protein
MSLSVAPLVVPLCYGIHYTPTTAEVSIFFSNHMRVTITFTLDNSAHTIKYSQWSGIEPFSARTRAPELDQTVVIKDLRIDNVSGHPSLFSGYIDVLTPDSVKCWRHRVAMDIELPCSPPDECAIESGSKRARESGSKRASESGSESGSKRASESGSESASKRAR